MIFSKIIHFAIYLLNTNVVDATDDEDYYKLLGVEKTATEHEIKKTFRRLALQFHPDKNKDEGAEKQFKKIVAAYEVLSDASQRKKYDQFGHTGNGFGGFGDFGKFDFTSFFKQFDDLFSQFGKGFQSNKRDRTEKRKERAGGGFKLNLDDLFSDMDFDEIKFFTKRKRSTNDDGESNKDSTEDHGFGDGDSFFGSHFKRGDKPTMNFGFNAEDIVKKFEDSFDDAITSFKVKMGKINIRASNTETKNFDRKVKGSKKQFVKNDNF